MLEQKIEELTVAIKALTAVVEQQSAAAPVTEAKADAKPEPEAKKAPAKKAPAKKKPEPKPDPEQTEPASDVPDEDWGDAEADEPMGLDEFRKIVMRLGPAEGPKFLANYDAKRISDVPEEDRRAVAADAQKILGD